MLVSVVIPAYNEAAALPVLRQRLTVVLADLPQYDFEVVLVDDHSSDETPALIQAWAQVDPRVRGIRLSANRGSHVALVAGLEHCRGDCAILMAADLQDPPELLAELLERWQAGHELVWAVRSGPVGRSWTTRLGSRAYWASMRLLSGTQVPATGADFVLLDRQVIDGLRTIAEKNTSLFWLLLWMGYRQTQIRYQKQPRQAGRSGWTLAKRVRLMLDSIVSISALPIRLTWGCGLLFLFATVGWILTVLGGRLSGLLNVGAGTAATIGLLLGGLGLVLTFMGLSGEYLWRTYDQVRGRPRYLVERVIGPAPSRFVPESPASEVAEDVDRSVCGPEGPVPSAPGRNPAGPAKGLRELHLHAGADG